MTEPENDAPTTSFCVVCEAELTGRQTKVCSDRECHRIRTKETVHEYYLKHREKIRAYTREYRQNNLEKEQEYGREYRLKHREKMKERAREYYQSHREEGIKRAKKHYQKNPEKANECSRKHYRRSRGLPEDWDLSKTSSIEVIMKQWLQDLDIEFVEQHYISLKEWGANKTWVDFFIEPNICFYSDGDFHHGPKRPDIQERDTRINTALDTGGYIVIRLSESDIMAGIRPVEILELIQ